MFLYYLAYRGNNHAERGDFTRFRIENTREIILIYHGCKLRDDVLLYFSFKFHVAIEVFIRLVITIEKQIPVLSDNAFYRVFIVQFDKTVAFLHEIRRLVNFRVESSGIYGKLHPFAFFFKPEFPHDV